MRAHPISITTTGPISTIATQAGKWICSISQHRSVKLNNRGIADFLCRLLREVREKLTAASLGLTYSAGFANPAAGAR